MKRLLKTQNFHAARANLDKKTVKIDLMFFLLAAGDFFWR